MKTKEHAGIDRETAAGLINRWVSYVPCSEWPTDILGDKPVRKNGKTDETDDDAE